MDNEIEKSKKFYHDLFGLDMILDNDGNMILTEGLVLQDKKFGKIYPSVQFPSLTSVPAYPVENGQLQFIDPFQTLPINKDKNCSRSHSPNLSRRIGKH